MSNGAGAGAAAAAAAVQAIKASGVIVRVEPDAFQRILEHSEEPLVVTAGAGLFGRDHAYLTSYKGLAFYTKSDDEIPLPGSVELVRAKSIWIPG